jgi:O-antigen/teichoic acid export membrane protein/glycosyltransferase involved in cell wall biosynthesis
VPSEVPAAGGPRAVPDGNRGRRGTRALRVVHCPVNTAGVPWQNVEALRRHGVDAKLVVFERYRLHPEADWSLDRSGGFLRRQLAQWKAFLQLLPHTDVFHFYFGLTLIPKSFQFPILRLLRKKSVFHFLGSDIRGRSPEELSYTNSADAQIVGSYDAVRWVPDAYVVPPGIDLRVFRPVAPIPHARPLVVHAPSNRARKGTEHVIAACRELEVDLEIVEGLHHAEARRRYERADIVVDQLNAGWYGLFAIEAMALGKPVVTSLHADAVERTQSAFGVPLPLVHATKETLVDTLRALVESPEERARIGAESRAYVEQVHDADRSAARLLEIYEELATEPRAARLAPAAPEGGRLHIFGQISKLGKQSAIYGLGGLVSRILAVLLLPLYTSYLSTNDYGKIETLVAAAAVVVILLQLGITSAFFRFYFDARDDEGRIRIVRTSFWFTMVSATAGLVLALAFAEPISQLLKIGNQPGLVVAAAIGMWAQMNYAQLTSVFRAEDRAVGYVIASLSNVVITVGATVLLVAVFREGPLGVLVGNFIGTLCVYFVLLGYRRYQLGLQFDRKLFRAMNKFGMPLVPAALALWAVNFIDRLFIASYKGQGEVGVYSVAVRVSSAIVFLMIAFRTAWPAFAYSIEDDREARRTYSYVLTYVVYVTCWVSLAFGVLAPWIVHVLARNPSFQRASEAVALLSFGGAAYTAYTVMAIGSGRARKTQWNWVIAGIAAAVNVGLNVLLIPPYGMEGAAIATCAAYVALFVGMVVYSQEVYYVPYQWRRVLTATGAAVILTVLAAVVHVPLAVAVVLVLVYPLVLIPLGFYLPAELRRLRRLVPVGN